MRVPVFIIFILCVFAAPAQNSSNNGTRMPDIARAARIDFQTLPEISVGLKLLEIHQPHFKSVDQLKNLVAMSGSQVVQKKKAGAPMPFVQRGFAAQVPSGTPLDNNLAISKGGKIISAVNTTLRVYDTIGNLLYGRSLSAIANQLGTLDRPFDPKVIYDQEADRFILVFLNGSDHTNTSVIAGFSETNDPAGVWNFYRITGNTGSNNWWSDYPFIGISKNELFITVLLWPDGASGWDTDAADENIWQLSKKDGYEGKSLRQVVYNGIKGNGRQLWNSRPVTGGDKLYGPDFYLLSNRPKDLGNDTFFLIHITGEIDDPNRSITVNPVISDLSYGLQPNSTQKGGRRLRTNYCDIHAGIRLGDQILFVANSRDEVTGRPGIYLGKLTGLNSGSGISARMIASDTLDLNYPNIAYAGSGLPDYSAMVVCLHNSVSAFPGTSAFYVDRNMEVSGLLRVKEGEGEMNILFSDTLERWGDYTGIHRDYSTDGSVWLAGSFGRASGGTSQTWIANLTSKDPLLPVYSPDPVSAPKVYPNPGRFFQAEFTAAVAGEVRIKLVAADGKVHYLASQQVLAGKNQLSIALDNASVLPGVLFLEITQGGKLLLREKLVVIN